jgi:hypothetical protein
LVDSGGTDRGGENRSTQSFEIVLVPSSEPVEVFIVDVRPDPRTEPVNEIMIVFSQPVVGFGLGDLKLTRDAGQNLLADAQASLTSDDGIVWTLGNLDAITDAEGRYRLSLDADGSDVRGESGALLAGDAVEIWVDNRLSGNPLGRYDVNRSGTVTALDALLIINYLSHLGEIPIPGDYDFDVSGDGVISSLDALLVINQLSRIHIDAVAEAEAGVGRLPPAPDRPAGDRVESTIPSGGDAYAGVNTESDREERLTDRGISAVPVVHRERISWEPIEEAWAPTDETAAVDTAIDLFALDVTLQNSSLEKDPFDRLEA